MAQRWTMTSCEQAGQWISLRLDGELSELEQVRLDRHLDRCAACNARAADWAGITHLLRAAPLVRYEPEPVRAATSRARALPARTAAFAAMVSAAAAAIALALFGIPGATHADRTTLAFRSAGEEAQFLRVQQLRFEPPRPAPAVETAPRFTPLRLL
jgi:anti-sigma factor RsiW